LRPSDILILGRAAPAICATSLVIDRVYLSRHRATAIRLTSNGPLVAHAMQGSAALTWQSRNRPIPERAAPAAPDPAGLPDHTPDGPEGADTGAELSPKTLQ